MEAKFSPPMLDLSTSDKHAAFNRWKARWDDYKLVTDFEGKTDEYKSALLRYCFTESTREVYESLTLTDEERKKESIIITALAKFAKGVINETLEGTGRWREV